MKIVKIIIKYNVKESSN